MKHLFTLFLALPWALNAQNFDLNNEPAIGSLVSLHLCDSNANILANTTGSGVTWDFSQISGIFGITKDVQILDATLDPNIISFTGASKLYDIGGSFQTFYSSSAASRISQGFIFNEPSLGTVVASWATDNQIWMTYPFALGNSVNDNFIGTVTTTATGTVPATGTSYSIYDGIGTLLLPGNNTYANVQRFHLKDSALATVFGTTVNFVRDVYEYYDFSVSQLPIFLTQRVAVNSALVANSSTVILSKDQPLTFVGTNELNAIKYSLYPNPAQDKFQIKGLSIGSPFEITQANGQVVLSGNYENEVDVTHLDAGVYFIRAAEQIIEFIK